MSPTAAFEPRMILLLGCTASGKTAVSLELAKRMGAEILSIDSMQVYRRMNVGTAKPSPEELASVRHHLIDVAEPNESFSVAKFVEAADSAIAEMSRRGRTVLAVAGTPLYLMGLMYGMFAGPAADETIRAGLRDRARREGTTALHAELAGVDPEAAARIHPNDYKRIERALEVWQTTGKPLSTQQQQWGAPSMRYPARVVGIRRAKEDNARRINARVKAMIDAGRVEEVRALLAEPAGVRAQAAQALGYAQIIWHLQGRAPLEDAVEQIKIQTRRLAKHQRTWFRKFQMTHWLDVGVEETPQETADRIMSVL